MATTTIVVVDDHGDDHGDDYDGVLTRSLVATLVCSVMTLAKDIYVCSSHGLFNANAVSILDESPVHTVFVTNSVPLPEGWASSKIEQVRADMD